MIVLAFDTCLSACSAAVTQDGRVLAAASDPMERGHQERLATLVQDLMAEAGVAFADVDRIGVTVGPGSFTGLRVGLAFAKGLGLALDRPVVGVGTLEALAASLDPRAFVAAAIDARREQLYLQVFSAGVALTAPEALTAGDAASRLTELYAGDSALLVGSGAHFLEHVIPGAVSSGRLAPDPVAVARLTAEAPAPSASAPRPLYLRAPDARLPA